MLVNSVILNLSVGWIQGSSTSLRGGLGSLRTEHPTFLGTLSQNVATTIPRGWRSWVMPASRAPHSNTKYCVSFLKNEPSNCKRLSLFSSVQFNSRQHYRRCCAAGDQNKKKKLISGFSFHSKAIRDSTLPGRAGPGGCRLFLTATSP